MWGSSKKLLKVPLKNPARNWCALSRKRLCTKSWSHDLGERHPPLGLRFVHCHEESISMCSGSNFQILDFEFRARTVSFLISSSINVRASAWPSVPTPPSKRRSLMKPRESFSTLRTSRNSCLGYWASQAEAYCCFTLVYLLHVSLTITLAQGKTGAVGG